MYSGQMHDGGWTAGGLGECSGEDDHEISCLEDLRESYCVKKAQDHQTIVSSM